MERLGTGVRRIREEYQGTGFSPSFDVVGESVVVVLPLVDGSGEVSRAEQVVLAAMVYGEELTREAIEGKAGLSHNVTIRALGSLVKKGAVRRLGAGRATRYVRS
jgi:ATP-dependent DNA helicase RecG